MYLTDEQAREINPELEFGVSDGLCSKHGKPIFSSLLKRFPKATTGCALCVREDRRTPEALATQRAARYGMTAAQWDAQFERQGRRCAGCGTEDPGSVNGWFTDHAHDGDEDVRGILCSGDNIALSSKMTPARLRALANYLEHPAMLPTRQLLLGFAPLPTRRHKHAGEEDDRANASPTESKPNASPTESKPNYKGSSKAVQSASAKWQAYLDRLSTRALSAN